MSYLKLNNVCKSFGDLKVIKNVELAVEQGQFVVFVGPSGCGKSTLLRLIAGLESLTDGEIHLDGVDLSNKPSSKRDMAMVFQSYALYPHMTVRNNMSFALKQANVPKDEIKKKVDAVAETLALTPYLDRKPANLSGGQRQRVAIGRSIVRSPKAFLFDEPLSNLDAALRVDMRLEIARLHKELGATTIYVTHDQVEAMTLADVVVVLRDGVIEQCGAPVELYDNPRNQFVAEFIGTPRMSVIDGTLTKPAGSTHVSFGKSNEMPVELQQTPSDNSRAIKIGARPEYITFTNLTQGDVDGSVELVERLGSDTFAYVNIGVDKLLTVRLGGHESINVGDNVGVKFDHARLHVFDDQGLNLTCPTS